MNLGVIAQIFLSIPALSIWQRLPLTVVCDRWQNFFPAAPAVVAELCFVLVQDPTSREFPAPLSRLDSFCFCALRETTDLARPHACEGFSSFHHRQLGFLSIPSASSVSLPEPRWVFVFVSEVFLPLSQWIKAFAFYERSGLEGRENFVLILHWQQSRPACLYHPVEMFPFSYPTTNFSYEHLVKGLLSV